VSERRKNVRILTRREFIGIVGLGVTGLATSMKLCGQEGNGAEEKLNVMLIMTDDQGYGDLSCHGNPILKTPNLDQLHSCGTRFTDFHVTPMCTLTRGQLLMGRDALDNGATFVNHRSMMRHGLTTIADIFRINGYRTGLFGKWHLGDDYPHYPLDRSFETVILHGAWGIASIADYFGNDYFNDTYRSNGRYREYEGYCTDIWFDEAMHWMKDRQRAGERFFCYVSTNAPHEPHWVGERYAEPYKGRGPVNFFGLIANLGENMGWLMRFLEAQGLVSDTVLRLNVGDCQVHTMFSDVHGKELYNAYYTEVERLQT